MNNSIGITAVIGKHVTGDHRVRSELVGGGGIGTQPRGFIGISAVGIEPKLVDLSQTSANVEWS